MQIHLVDIDYLLVDAWRIEFTSFPEVRIQQGDILSIARNTIVSPANSYGLMDGGIDQLYIDFFGVHLQEEVLKRIADYPDGLLPVGSALLVPTGHPIIPYLISAPTMIEPEAVSSANSFFAMSAVLKTAWRRRTVVTDVFCPGLATGTGMVPPEIAAREMANAYRKWKQAQIL